MTLRPVPLVILAISSAPLAALHGQSGADLIDRGVRAYQEVDMEGAVGFLRRWLASDARASAGLAQGRRAFTYLGAAEVLRGNTEAAVSAFESLIELDPRARLDQLIFPPDVTTRFEAVRARTKVVGVEATDGEEFSGWLFASSPHRIRAVVRRPQGDPIRLLYTGFIGDSLSVRWNGQDSTGAHVSSGSYLFEVVSTPAGQEPQRVLQVPLEVTAHLPDTLPTPAALPDSLLKPERRGAAQGVEALLGGVVAGVGIAVLPPLLAPDAQSRPLRFAVAGGVSLVGALGFFRGRPGGIIAANRQANAELRRAWRDSVAAVAEQNRALRAATSFTIRAGQPLVVRLTEP